MQRLPENHDLEYIFGDIGNGNNIISDSANRINYENFYNNGYYWRLLDPTPTPASTLQPIIVFNGINNKISRIDILQSIFGVIRSEHNIANEKSCGMLDFYLFYCFQSFFSFSYFSSRYKYKLQELSSRWTLVVSVLTKFFTGRAKEREAEQGMYI